MKDFFRRHSKYTLTISACIVAFIAVQWLAAGFIRGSGAGDKTYETAALDTMHPLVHSAMVTQARYSDRLMAMPDIVGTAV